MNPPDLKYSKEHEWVRMESESVAAIGLTEFAVEQLEDIVFLELPKIDDKITQFQQLGEVESVKAVSEIYSPLSGRVVERNEQAVQSPELVNDGPYESGWLLKVELVNVAELDSLMTAEEYNAFIAAEQA